MINCKTNKKGIKELLQTEMLDFSAPIIVNNLPAIDGCLISQREVIWGMFKGHKTSDKPTFKMLKCGGNIMDYYVLGDMPLYGVMKNMGNNYTLNKYLKTKGSFGDKNKVNGKGSAPRYIECTLNKYAETMLDGIKKNAVPMKNNYDFTEKEPVVLPSMIPNILTNLRMSIAVSEANKMPSHNMEDVCNSIQSYIKTKDINKSIELIKAPDLPTGGSIIYDKKVFEQIYKTGKGSFSIIGNYKYDKKENTIHIYEIPYTTFIENIEQEIENKLDKFKNEISDYHNGSDKQGINLELYLKNGVNPNVVIQKLRKYTSFEDKFSCNFTILDLDNKTPKLMSLEDIITRWIKHRQTCIMNEINYDININKTKLNELYGLKIINNNLDETIKIIRASKNEKIASETLSNRFNLNKEQSEYIASIKLIKLNKEWINSKLSNIEILEKINEDLKNKVNDEDYINNKIIEQLEEVKKEFNQPRKTKIIYEDVIGTASQQDLIEDYNCNIIITEQNYIKKFLKQSDSHKLKDGDSIIQEFKCNNKDTLFFFTNTGYRIKLSVNDLELKKPNALGEYIPTLLSNILLKDEEIIKVIAVPQDAKGYIINAYDSGKISKVNISAYISNYTRLANSYDVTSQLLDIKYVDKDVDILFISEDGKALICNTDRINAKGSRKSQGNVGIKLNDDCKIIFSQIKPSIDELLIFTLIDDKQFELRLDDIAPTNKPNEERSVYEYISGRTGNKGNLLTKKHIKSITVE